MKRLITLTVFALLPSAALIAGCAGDEKKDHDFFTSGDRSADQRADQRMAKDAQLKGEGQAAENKTVKDGDKSKAPEKRSLYDRLGADAGIQAIVEDFVPRVLADPRVNWERKGVKRGGFNIHRGQSMEWSPTPQNVQQMKLHLVQFIALATGGPSIYQGREMKEAHGGLHIANPEFDASVGDLKATLDKQQIPNQEQKELLSIVESTRPLIVEER